MDTAKLLHLMMTGRRIDVAQIISNEMRNVAESGKEFGSGIKSSCPLIFPGLIIGLLIASRVRLPNLTIFKIKIKVDDKMQIHPGMQSNEGQQFMQSNEGQLFMTPDEFVGHIVWTGYRTFYQKEGVGPEEEAEAGTLGGSKTASEAGDGMESEFMVREE
ncbi:hypothetical protein RYX36_009057 [Vicia faba]